jgi:hypothetical protein
MEMPMPCKHNEIADSTEQIRTAPEVLTIALRPFWIFCENMRLNGAKSFSATLPEAFEFKLGSCS